MALPELLTIISSVTFSTAASAVVVWLSREWIGIRLKGSIEHEYAQKLEAHKAQLKAEHDIALLTVKTAVERDAALHNAAYGGFAHGQQASMERKLNGVERLWTHVLKLRSQMPPVLTFIDVLTVDEYRGAKDHPSFRTLAGDLSPEKIAALADPSIEQVRPYVGEYMWAVFYSYQAIQLRLLVLLNLGGTDAEKLEWHKDSGTRQLMAAVLTKNELEQFDERPFGKVSWIQRQLEAKILDAAQKVISGERFGADSLEQAHRIQDQIAKLKPSST